MPRYKLTLAYDGTCYHGWQRQVGKRTIQGTLEEAILDLFGNRVKVVGSGRTDARVHALGQAAHVDLSLFIHSPDLCAALNSRLPGNIRVRETEVVPKTFHARYSAVKRAYCYLIRAAVEPSPFLRNYTHQVRFPLDSDAMNKAAAILVGTHDFSAFRSTGGGNTLPTRKVFNSEVFFISRHTLCYFITADAFLRKMVRGIVGTLLEIGAGKADVSVMSRLLKTGDRTLMATVAPPQGLYLVAVSYA